jgi:hypothetical protein
MVVCALLLVGCAEPSQWDRIPLEGTVTLDGTTTNGALTLRPRAGNRGPAVTADIQDGRYRFTSRSGPVAGANTAILMMPGDPGSPPSESSITLSVDVPAEKPFELPLDFTQPVAPAPKPQRQNAFSEAMPPTK